MEGQNVRWQKNSKRIKNGASTWNPNIKISDQIN